MDAFPARIHVLLASQAPVGLVIRRGPAKCVATILWNRTKDEFQLGQWLKGRIYERRSDLSPDGKYLVYFAMNGKWQSETGGAWTAVSRVPYLKAVALYGKGDCWNGGGLWTNVRRYWLNDGYGHTLLQATQEVRRDRRFEPKVCYGGECPGVYYHRLLRDGWQLRQQETPSKFRSLDAFEKSMAHGWLLRKIAHGEIDHPVGKGCYWDEHQLLHQERRAVIACPDWEWADWDGRRLLWARDGQLFAGTLVADGLSGERLLFDFNQLAFEPLEAPY